jgi:VWFA-related protein
MLDKEVWMDLKRTAVAGMAAIISLTFQGAVPAADSPVFLESVKSTLLEIPIQVMRRGEPVDGLTIDDFVVRIDGRSVTNVGLEVADLRLEDGAVVPDVLSPELSLMARRHFLLLFDLGFSRSESIRKAREAVREWVVDSLHPWDLVGVAVYDAKRGVRQVLNFTSDREQIDLAVASLGHPNLVAASGDPLGLELGFAKQRFSIEADTARTGQGKGGDTTEGRGAEAVETMSLIYHSAYEPVNLEGQRHHVYEWTQSLTELADTMASIKGRKYVVLMSEGFESSLVFASGSRQDVDFLNQAAERGEIWKINSSKRFGSALAQRNLGAMVEQFRRSDCTIQAIDISGSRDAADAVAGGSSNGLFYIANETGGELQRSYGGIKKAMNRVAAQTSVTYLLTVRPDTPDDGKYHRIKIRMPGASRGTRITHRPGFYPALPYEDLSAEARRQRAAESILSGEEFDRLATRVFASPISPGPDGKTRVPVLVEIDGLSLPYADESGVLGLEIFAYALQPDGGVGGFFTHQLFVDMNKIGTRVRAGGLKFFGDIDLDPGDYSLRVLVRERGTGAAGSRVLSLSVPDPADLEAWLAAPQFVEPRGKWVLVRHAGSAERPFPFMFDGEPYLPAAMPVWDGRNSVGLILAGRSIGEQAFDLHAAILGEDDNVFAEPEIRLVQLAPTEEGSLELFRAQMDRVLLPGGPYQLEVTVSDPVSGRSLTRRAPFILRPESRMDRITEVSPR